MPYLYVNYVLNSMAIKEKNCRYIGKVSILNFKSYFVGERYEKNRIGVKNTESTCAMTV